MPVMLGVLAGSLIGARRAGGRKSESSAISVRRRHCGAGGRDDLQRIEVRTRKTWKRRSKGKTQRKRMDDIMGRLLRTGVILAAGVCAGRGRRSRLRDNTAAGLRDYRVFHGEPGGVGATVPGIIHEALALHGRGLIQFGFADSDCHADCARLRFSVVAFLYQRDWTYVAVTLIVLGLLIYSLLGGGGGG